MKAKKENLLLAAFIVMTLTVCVGQLAAQAPSADLDELLAAPVVQAIQSIRGTMVPGNNLAGKLAWLQSNVESRGTYIIEVDADENVAPRRFEYTDMTNVTIVLRGVDANRTIRLSANGIMFTVPSTITLILDNNITLQGLPGNNSAMILVDGGTFMMNAGSAITGNGGVGVIAGVRVRHPNPPVGTFVMNGGAIHRNTGGGVRIVSGSLTMKGGTISDNTAPNGGGVFVGTGGNVTFTMDGGAISNNIAKEKGGGVFIENGEKGVGRPTFTMNDGIISGNSASSGGGVYAEDYVTFNMRGGTITSNIATEYGGGVCVEINSTFSKTGGIITGHNSDQEDGNVVGKTNVLTDRGHAVSVVATGAVEGRKRKESTAGPEDELSISLDGWMTSFGGTWDE
ncbi:MAG: hypothetical protein LBU70_05805 [Chitinispirillales bacterium]|jgi:hypothetical protein|nr:hypothetical protein [Chitinispirillales bacterium]